MHHPVISVKCSIVKSCLFGKGIVYICVVFQVQVLEFAFIKLSSLTLHSPTMSQQELVDNFIMISGASKDKANSFLKTASWNLEVCRSPPFSPHP